jgi:hypothetical protein
MEFRKYVKETITCDICFFKIGPHCIEIYYVATDTHMGRSDHFINMSVKKRRQ